MANEEQLSILKQGVEVWNKWREDNPDTKIDLSSAPLYGMNLREANLIEANLWRAQLIGTNLYEAKLDRANLYEAQLSRCYLKKASLVEAELIEASIHTAQLEEANFSKASLNQANLSDTNLSFANLSFASLTHAVLDGTLFRETNLRFANFSLSVVGGTTFGNIDLSETLGLEDGNHLYPSTIGIDTLQKSKGKIPEAFLKGCGLSDWEIEQSKLSDPNLSNEEINNIQYKMYDLRATQALQFFPLFISYSHADSLFVDKIESKLNKKGIRFWRDIHDMKSGRMEKQIDRAITQNRTVLLVLSEHSLKSDWVEHEVRTARGLERDMGRDVLCPIALDDSWKTSPWPARVMEQIKEYNILDFSAWENDVKFEGMFRKLIDGLQLFYKDKSHGE